MGTLKKLITFSTLTVLSALLAAQDNFENGVLTITEVFYQDVIYSDVSATIKKVISIQGGTPLAEFDGYYPQTNQLFIPEVILRKRSYTNITTEINEIISVGALYKIYETPVYTYPSSIEEITYPDSYLISNESFDFKSIDPCNLDIETINIPKIWMGYGQLPEITGAPFPNNIKYGTSIKDIMLSNNPAFILDNFEPNKAGCNGTATLKDEFDRTLERLNSVNVDYVYIPQWHWLEITQNGDWRIMEAERTFGPVIDSDLSYFVQKAKELGIKVIMYNQIEAAVLTDSNGSYGSAFYPEFNQDNYEKWLFAYKVFMEERAIFFDSIGVDIFSLTCDICMFNPNSSNYSDTNYDQYVSVIKEIYEFVANETNLLTTIDMGPYPEIYSEELDSLADYHTTGGFILNENEIDEPTVSEIRERFSLSSLTSVLKYNKPVIYRVNPSQSRGNWYEIPGYLEETVCTSQLYTFNLNNQICLQKLIYPDFISQAITVEGSLEAINNYILDNNVESEVVILNTDFWATDVLMPYTAFPNLGATIRNKPAEGIYKTWFER